MGIGIVRVCKLLFPVWYLLSSPVPCLHSSPTHPCHPIVHSHAVIPVPDPSFVHFNEWGSWKGSIVLGG